MDETADKALTGGDGKWTVGCAVALTILTVLAGLGAVALREFEQGLDGTGQIETSDGPDGSVTEPFTSGATARYEDGLKVTVGDAEKGRGGVHTFAVTFENGTDEPLPLDDTGSYAADGLLDVCEGDPRDDCAPGDARDVTWLNAESVTARLTGTLDPGESRTVPLRIEGDGEGAQPVTVETTPYSASHRDTVYWRLDIG
ncbi:hypothetical protein GCM10009801_46410 [Streptomyces albiaxialis]|uniref:DUF4352 domain-containing protein n=2 Tax=Streptomyces albiaxialis TaxID=329523 RepID=A0ABP5HVR1_9ACTN